MVEQELRLAVAMTGGVSLAVWMGGVTNELHRLLGDEPAVDDVYAGLRRLTATTVRIDVISGSSAGGLNGALLGFAIANGCPSLRDSVREAWLELGALDRLLRSPFEKDPPSLLQGDGVFLPAIEDVLHRIRGDATVAPSPLARPVELIVTTSMLDAQVRRFPDAFGGEIVDVDHAARFRFAHGPSDPVPDGPAQLTHRDVPRRLALAVRASASFPGAFEPAFIPVKESMPTRLDMDGVASFEHSKWVVDGGVLVNRPIRPAIDAVFAQRAEQRVRRVLVYVVPDPGAAPVEVVADASKPPALFDVLQGSIVTMPRNESVARELQDLAAHNRRIEDRRRIRDGILAPEEPGAQGFARMQVAARSLYPTYRQLRAERSVAATLDRILSTGRTAAMLGRFPERSVGALRRAMRDARTELLPPDYAGLVAALGTGQDGGSAQGRDDGDGADAAGGGEVQHAWPLGIQPVDDMTTTVLDYVRRLHALVPVSDSPAVAEVDSALGELRGVLHDGLERLRSVRARDGAHWEGQVEAMAERLRSPGGDLDLTGLATQAYGSWMGGQRDAVLDELRDVARSSADAAIRAAEQAAALLDAIDERDAASRADSGDVEAGTAAKPRGPAVPDDVADELRRIARVLEALAPPAEAADPARTDLTLRRLVALEILQVSRDPRGSFPEQAVELMQISARTPDVFRHLDRVDEKLTGVQLGHFGAFYRKAWRANDWLWGRLDGAARAVELLLDPRRLRQVHFGAARPPAPGARDHVLGEIRTIAEGSDPALSPWLAKRWKAVEHAVRDELAYLDDGSLPIPARLPNAVKALTMRVQLEILVEEMPGLAATIREDEMRGATVPAEAITFADAVDRAEAEPQRRPAAYVAAHRLNHVGRERITDVRASDYLSTVATQAAGVAASVAQSSASGLGFLRRFLHPLRGVALTLHVLARSALDRGGESRTHRAGVIGLFVTAGLLVAAAVWRSEPGLLLGSTALVVVVTTLAWAAIRVRAPALFAILSLTAVSVVAVLSAAPLYEWVRDREPPADGAIHWIAQRSVPLAVVLLVAGFGLLGVLSSRSPRRRGTQRRP